MTFRYRLTIAACVGLAFCLLTTVGSDQSAAQSKGSEDIDELEQWQFPGAKSKRRTRGDAITASDYMIDKPFEDVWQIYAKKFGSKQDYKPNLTAGEGHADSQGNNYQVQILNSASERTGVRSATLIRHEKEKTIVVHISRGKDEEKTYFTLIVQSK